MKVAFTSCCDVVNDDVQDGWMHLSTQRPQHVVMLGDNIYMDYGFGPHEFGLGAPRDLSLPEFSDAMHGYYARQWRVPTFRAARANQPIYAIWDDHDFAWNNARGGGSSPDAADFVPEDKRRLSRMLFQQFRHALANNLQVYPPNPYPTGVVFEDLGGIQSQVELIPGEVRLHLLDGRTFREASGAGAQLLGSAQREALAASLLPEPGINLLASGTTLDDWDRFADGAWLAALGETHRIVVLSGDIHKPRFDKRGRVFEATASALAQPPRWTSLWPLSRRTGVYGVMDFSREAIDITLYSMHEVVAERRIDRVDWKMRR